MSAASTYAANDARRARALPDCSTSWTGNLATDMSCTELESRQVQALAVSLQHVSRKQALDMFPDRPAGYVTTTKNLGHYAWKYTAMTCRTRGAINEALQDEAICDRIYDGLPEFARW